MKKLSKIIASALLCAMLLASCAAPAENPVSDNAQKTDVTTAAEPEKELTEEEKRQLISDGIPDGLDFGGEDFVMLVATEHLYDAYVAEMTGDIVDDAVYERNAAVSERLNINIPEAVNSDYGTCSNWLKNAINSGEDLYDLYLAHAVQSGLDALNGWFLNWYDFNYVNFEQPWYPSLAIESLTINNKMMLSVSDMAISATENTYCMFYDKVKAESYNLGDIYSIVNEGKWTADKLIELVKDIHVDENGNGESDDDDFYGFTSNCFSNSNTYLWAFDQPVVEITPELEVNITYNCEKTIDIVAKIRELYYGISGSHIFKDHGKGLEFFRTGHAIFVNGFIGHSVSQFRDYENDYGIIPYPKWDEAQEGYYTMADGNFSAIAAPVTIGNTDLVGAAVQALSAYSWKNVIPKYYDVALKVKGARDAESVALLDLILNGRVIDFAYLYDAWKGYVFTFEALTYPNDKTQFSSMYDSKLKACTKHYENVLNLFLEAGN